VPRRVLVTYWLLDRTKIWVADSSNPTPGVEIESMTQRILLVEDEPGLVMKLSDRHTSEGYAVETAGDAETGLARSTSESFDLIILDVMLPGGSGFDLCRDLRQRGIRTPIIMLTARGQVLDKVLGLKIGADDYITKPFEMMELLARVEVQLRRASKAATASLEAYQFGDVRVDFRRAEAYRGEHVVELSAKEFKLLRYLIEHRGAALSRDELLNQVWGYDAAVSTRTVDVHVAGLRQKLEANQRHPRFILTIHGTGYKFSG
jgi:two-component system alkaline phosphatase synthesis response regulator PhoP